MRFRPLALILLVFAVSLFSVHIEVVQVSEGPPPCYEIFVVNEGDLEITDFHFSVSEGGMILEEFMLPDGWELRYALPNSFLEADATEGHGIPAGGAGAFIVCVEGPIDELMYLLYFTHRGMVIPGTEREGALGPLSVESKKADEEVVFYISPNPLRHSCIIEIGYGWKIEVIDQLGRVVNTLGSSPARWIPDEGLINGIYFIRARKGDEIKTRRALLLR